MKLEFRYDPKTRHFYAPKKLIIVTVAIIVATILLGGLTIYRLRQDRNQLKTPFDEYRPLTLGQAPVSPETLPPTKEGAAETVLSELKKQHGNKFNIIFFYDGYQDQKDALLDIEVLKQSLDIVEPFKSLKDHIAFKIFTTEGQKCRIEASPKKYLVCDPKLIESFARLGIDHYKIVLVSPLDFIAASEVAYGKNTWIAIPTFQGNLSHEDHKRWLGIIFMQELGHSLGLRYEYFKGKPSSYVKESSTDGSTPLGHQAGLPNCAPDEATAKNWWDNYISVFENIGFYKGCAGNDNYVYPEQETLMSDLPRKESFGRVSEDYLRGAISCFYAGKESLIWPAGEEATYSAKLKSCDAFRKEYPSFWEE